MELDELINYLGVIETYRDTVDADELASEPALRREFRARVGREFRIFRVRVAGGDDETDYRDYGDNFDDSAALALDLQRETGCTFDIVNCDGDILARVDALAHRFGPAFFME